MFIKEFKTQIKSLLIWITVILCLFTLIFAIYPSIMSSDNIAAIDEMMLIFPEELLKAFNFDLASISTSYGYFKSEGLTLLVMISSCFSALLGSTILLKEEDEKTSEYMLTLPISRTYIINIKYATGILIIIIFSLITTLFNYFGLIFTCDINTKEYLMLSFSILLPMLSFYSIMFFISTLFSKTKYSTAISLGFVFTCVLIQMLSTMSSNVEFLKYFTILTLGNSRDIILNQTINISHIFITIFIVFITYIGSNYRYNHKEFV